MPAKSPILLSVQFDHASEEASLASVFEDRPVIDWLKDMPGSLEGVKYALVWKVDPDLFRQMPDLEVIFSAGAGVDKIMDVPDLPDVPVVRFVDDTLTTRMSEWVVLQCLMHLRQQRKYDAFQAARDWHELPQAQASDIRVGIMGLGVLGRDSAQKLKALGFQVNGWSRTKKEIEGIRCFDADETSGFLSQTDFLVGLLPLTQETRGFFNRSIFEQLPKHQAVASPVFINAGRGQSQVESDIISCLKDGTLRGASLDVFETEPLQADSPLWEMDNVFITPHAAASSDLAALGRYVQKQLTRHEAGEKLENIVDRSLGY